MPEKQHSTTCFSLYNERDVPFLNTSSSIGKKVMKKIIHAEMDDDVQTDPE